MSGRQPKSRERWITSQTTNAGSCISAQQQQHNHMHMKRGIFDARTKLKQFDEATKNAIIQFSLILIEDAHSNSIKKSHVTFLRGASLEMVAGLCCMPVLYQEPAVRYTE